MSDLLCDPSMLDQAWSLPYVFFMFAGVRLLVWISILLRWSDYRRVYWAELNLTALVHMCLPDAEAVDACKSDTHGFCFTLLNALLIPGMAL